MRKEGIYSKVAKALNLTREGVRSIATGRRGKRGSSIQEIVIKAVLIGEDIYDKADKEFELYCNQIKFLSDLEKNDSIKKKPISEP